MPQPLSGPGEPPRAAGPANVQGPPHHNGSFWFDSLDDLRPARAPGVLPDQVDVAIIGAGFTGLWTAYYLKQHRPDLDVAVFEANSVGFGASGRNGGWCMGLAYGIHTMLAQPDQRARGLDLLRAMQDTVDEVGRVSQAEGIDSHYAKGGTLNVATAPHHVTAFQQEVEHMHALGFTDEDYCWLPPGEAAARLNITPNHGAAYTRHCAAIHPARLVRGLGERLRARGVSIYELTPVIGYAPDRLTTSLGPVRAGHILRATEGYTDSVRGQSRQLMPLYSMMVATEPLPDALWAEIGLHRRETFGDGRRIVIYGQRTLDNRFAFGGRAGYYFGSRRRPTIPSTDRAVVRVEQTLRQLFPMLADTRVTHGWGGLMGVPRHWRPSVLYDRKTGLGSAGGYTGEGVAASNLAGRILADLVLERDTDITHLAWVGDRARRWEVEPLRWLGARAIEFFGERADTREFATGRPSRGWGRLFDRLVG